MPLTKEQFSALRSQGLTTEQIVKFEQKEQPKSYSLKQAGKDLMKVPVEASKASADFLNQLAFDVPRQAMERLQAGSWEANFGDSAIPVVQKAGGIAGAVYGGGALLGGVRNVAQMARAAGVPAMLTRAVGQSAVAGGIEGAIRQPNAEYTPENVAAGAGIGAMLGAGGVPLMQGLGRGIQRTFSGVPKSFEEFMQSGIAPKIKQKLTPEQQLKEQAKGDRTIRGQHRLAAQEERIGIREEKIAKAKDIADQKQYIDSQVIAAKQIKDEAVAQKKVALNKIKEEGKADLNSAKTKLDAVTTEAVRGTNAEIQKQLPSIFREARENFQSRLDVIDDKTNLKSSQVKDFFVSVLNDSSVKGGASFNKIADIAKKYGIKIEVQDDLIMGKMIKKIDDNVSVKSLLEDVKAVGSTLSSSAKSGGRWTQDDVAYAVMGDHLSSFVPDLADLRSSYRPILMAMKEGARVFKPSMGEMKTNSAEAFLKRIATGKAKQQDEWLMKMIEQPSKFSSGIGGVTQGLKQTVRAGKADINSVEMATKARIEQIEKKFGRKLAGIKEGSYKWQKQQKALSAELQEANRMAELARIAVQQGEVLNQQELARRMAIIAKREVDLTKKRNAQAIGGRIKEAAKWAALGAAGMGGLSAAQRYGAGRGSQAIEDVSTVLSGE